MGQEEGLAGRVRSQGPAWPRDLRVFSSSPALWSLQAVPAELICYYLHIQIPTQQIPSTTDGLSPPR